MGDINSSDSSWKKIVIAKTKTNNEWISSIKKEDSELDENASDESENEVINIRKFKKENVECMNAVADHPEEDQVDPLSLLDPICSVTVDSQTPDKKRRPKGAGPKKESPDERSARLAKMSAYAAQRLANETPEQRAVRLRRMSDYAAKRLAHETSDQRAKRLARMSAYAAKRLANESPEQRQARLSRMSAYAARRHAMKKSECVNPCTNDLSSNFDPSSIMHHQS